jgi:hypothetical protein
MVIIYMPIPTNQKLYDEVKKEADKIYKKPSAYKSGWIVKNYKQRGGQYKEDGKSKDLKRWFREQWKDVGGLNYPVYRPTKRVSKKTPLIPQEINPKQLKQQIALKQIIKGQSNLPPFLRAQSP